MAEKIWIFEDDWYIRPENSLPLCVNSREAAEMILEFIEAIDEIHGLIESLPSGIDYDADPNNLSPEDTTAHIGGLIWKICEKVLPSRLEDET